MTAADPLHRIDPHAVAAWRRRLARQPAGAGAPWLPAEVARRLHERLTLIRATPRCWIDASGDSGADAERLRQAYPASLGVVLHQDALGAATARDARRRPWWRLARRDSSIRDLGPDEAWPPDVGLVWSNLALHWDPDPPATFTRWQSAVVPGGFVMFSVLGPGTLRELRAIHRARGWGTIGAEFVDMHDLGDMLVQAGFADPVMDQETLTLTWDDPQRLLADLRAWGVNAAPDRHAGLRTPLWRDRWLEALAPLRGPDGRLSLSIEVAYGHAFQADRPAREAGTGSISVDALRATARKAPPRAGPG
jgi:malonyl-CoA O-methyltransferase